jgi:hypothetical protein
MPTPAPLQPGVIPFAKEQQPISPPKDPPEPVHPLVSLGIGGAVIWLLFKVVEKKR